MRPLPSSDEKTFDFVAYVTKGLVDVCEDELLHIVPEATVRDRSERFLIVRMLAGDAERLGGAARTVDDLRLLVAGPSDVGGESGFTRLCTAASSATESVLDVGDAAGRATGPWSVTMSARNPPWRQKPRWDAASVIEKHLHGALLSATNRHPVDLRIQVDGSFGHISLNLWPQPIGKHLGELVSNWRGALKPTVAASLVRLALAQVSPSVAARGVYDPFCGSGTIVNEAMRAGLLVFASDQSPEAVEMTRSRLAGQGADPDALLQQVFVKDVLSGPDPRVTAQVMVANLPWGKQVEIEGRGALFDATALLVRHFVRSSGAAVLLTTREEQLIARLRSRGLTTQARRIGLLGQTPVIVTIRPA